MNGAAGNKCSVPFAMILRGSYGVRGSALPGTVERDCRNYVVRTAMLCRIAGISNNSDWQNMAEFLTLGGDFTLLGFSAGG